MLACGHSARDVFELLRERRRHASSARRLRWACVSSTCRQTWTVPSYGPSAGHPALGAAPYKLVSHLPSGRSAYSFCMCPGGYVVAAASEEGGVVTNGMSLAARAGTNANSGLLANVLPSDLPGDDPLVGIELQRACERAAFELGGGAYVAPAQLVGDFLAQPAVEHGRARRAHVPARRGLGICRGVSAALRGRDAARRHPRHGPPPAGVQRRRGRAHGCRDAARARRCASRAAADLQSVSTRGPLPHAARARATRAAS